MNGLSALLVAEALLPVILTIALFATRDAIRARIASSIPGLTTSQLHTHLVTRLSTDVIENGVVAAACILLAVKIHRGRRWAWIVTLVVAVLLVPSILRPLTGLIRPASSEGNFAWLAFAAGALGVALVVVLLLPSPRRYCAITAPPPGAG